MVSGVLYWLNCVTWLLIFFSDGDIQWSFIITWFIVMLYPINSWGGGDNFKVIILRFMIQNSSLATCEIVLRPVPQNLTNENSTLIQVGAVRHKAISWANVDPDLCCYMASLGHNELITAMTTTEPRSDFEHKNTPHSWPMLLSYGSLLWQQSSAVITLSNITWYCIHHCSDWGRV